jgi:Flp pilus assembly pilin Flp
LSATGNIVAIGLPYNNGNGTYSGRVRIYQNINGIWSQISSDINGEAADDVSGRSISLSSNGSVIAIGATGNDGNGNGSGHVRVFQNVAGTWTQVGSDINGEFAGDASGTVSLSSDGSIVAIGAYQNSGYGHVRLFRNISNNWTQIGSDINGIALGDSFGSGISISGNAGIIAIGAPFVDGDGINKGMVGVYNLSAFLSSNSYVESNFNIYPNPSKGVVNISLDNNLQIEKVNFYNQIGQLVKTAKSNIISTLELEKGCYFIQVITSQGNATKQLIVE